MIHDENAYINGSFSRSCDYIKFWIKEIYSNMVKPRRKSKYPLGATYLFDLVYVDRQGKNAEIRFLLDRVPKIYTAKRVLSSLLFYLHDHCLS